ncbi:T9SS type A sorting domain-containing protein [Siansivirga zeaxanthinifaciens]|uniref:Secretion system C-terminal sorting domain-containing protein n=1 Tax=Siansivirga zeaxanthinifaciens CC-SAMT-1 TaxID=1454006 RepID=A0A0C5WIE7_9FLAO|nr:T9SS type A sorting domain-containing protein [Siansivirga zeaxanthinifaciens]AJR04939.1 hypothetical protein AW14_11660 [Siansivirga zeaxanthinifaciens CC-SAMT-1]
MRKNILTLITVFCLSNLVSYAQLFSSKKSINTSTGDYPSVIESGHLNNDSHVDIVIGTTYGGTIEWYKNDGNQSFSMQTLITSTLTGILGLAIADLDNDNDNDIVAASYFSGKLVWFENDGNGNFSSEKVIATGISEAGTVKVGKIDNNNTIDVVVAAGASGQVLWFSNNGNGTFSGSNLVVGFRDTRNVELYENQLSSTGTPTFLRSANGSISSNNSDLNEVSFADVDNDKKLDIIKVNKTTMASWYKKEANGSFTEHNFTTSYNYPATAKVADYDNDSFNDVIIGFANGTTVDALAMYDNSNFETLIDNTQDDINQFTVNDFDGDGDLDVASISQKQNDLNWFENLKFSATLGLKEITPIRRKIYPNPTREHLVVDGKFTKPYKASIYNILDKEVMQINVSNSIEKIEVASLKSGVYLLYLEDDKTYFKFVKL